MFPVSGTVLINFDEGGEFGRACSGTNDLVLVGTNVFGQPIHMNIKVFILCDDISGWWLDVIITRYDNGTVSIIDNYYFGGPPLEYIGYTGECNNEGTVTVNVNL